MTSPLLKFARPRLAAPVPSAGGPNLFTWLTTGETALREMIVAIDGATVSVRLEMYIYRPHPIGEQVRASLVSAAQRGCRVQVLVDALGGIALPGDFWDALNVSGGEVRVFNPLKLKRLGLRDHRKILVCDERLAFIGGFNIAQEYNGDGITEGWRDLGLKIRGGLARDLAVAFDEMFGLADFRHGLLTVLRRARRIKLVEAPESRLLLSAPGRTNEVKAAIRTDLKTAKRVQILCAYFLPTWSLRRDLMNVVARGGQVQLILPGKSDVLLSQLASRSLYRRLLRAGVEVFEYQPQILHAKLLIIDDVVYAGSANLDVRSLQSNYELLVRIPSRELADAGRRIFEHDLPYCERIEHAAWKRSRTFWRKIKERWAYLILARLDPFLTDQQVKLLR